MRNENPQIGQGIYTAADASRILKIPYAKASYWFKYYAKRRLSETTDYIYHFQVENVIAVNFLTLIEMYVFYALKEKELKTSKIIEAHTAMSEILRTPYPFAKEDIYINSKSLLFGSDDQLITADKNLQIVITQVLRKFISKVHFSDNRIAKKFYPLGKERCVVVNPENQFGQPVIDGTNILTETIYNLSRGGDSPEYIAKLYDISATQVGDAIEFAKAA
jgi:uncharacterized protein (DUF433 family)